MRIDYFIVSEKLKERIVACEMHGHGIELQGNSVLLHIQLFFHTFAATITLARAAGTRS